MENNNNMYDAIVVGGGIAGLCVAWTLAHKRHKRVLLLEQFSILHSEGSSHGDSRIIRSFYKEDAFYVKSLANVFQAWTELEKEFGVQLVYPAIGFLYLDHEKSLDPVQKYFDQYSVSYERLFRKDLCSKFPQFENYPDSACGFLDKTGGVIHASKTMEILYRALLQEAEVRDCEKAVNIVYDNGCPVVHTGKGNKFKGKFLILAAGPWTSHLLIQNQLLKIPLLPVQITVVYYKILSGVAPIYEPVNFPCFYDNHTKVFALPEFEYKGHVKFGIDVGPPVDPCHPEKTPMDSDVQILSSYIEKHFPSLNPKPAYIQRCLYTRTTDNNYVVDLLPTVPNTIIVAGLSGHGFKMGPWLGGIISDMLTDKSNCCVPHIWRIDRFSKPKL